MTGGGNDEQRITLVRELRIPFLAHRRALMPASGNAVVDIVSKGAFHDPRGCRRTRKTISGTSKKRTCEVPPTSGSV